MSFRPRLSTVLLTVNLAVIALPLGSIFFFRIYENQLIQETERELISQAALIGAFYRTTLRGPDETGRTARLAERGSLTAGASAGEAQGRTESLSGQPVTAEERWSHVAPQLDLARVSTLPSRPDGKPAPTPPTAAAAAAGRLLTPMLDRAQRTSLIGVRVLDRHGTTVGGTAEIGENFAHVEEVAQALKGRYASALRYRELENAPSELSSISRGTGVRVFVAFPVISGGEVLGAVYLSRTPKSILRHLYEEREKAILALVTVLVLAISLAVLTSRTISRPVAELLARTRRVARGETAVMEPLGNPGTREMAELSDGISQMATALADRAAYIRTLASQVSHEFKTPLTSIQGAVELLQDHHDTMTAAERERFLANISGDGARLRALLDRLLDLARAENTVRSDARTGLAAVVSTAVSGLPPGITAQIEIPDGLDARIPSEALQIVLGNLLDNAAEHDASEVRISAEGGAEFVTMRIADDGRGISPANRNKIFEHFFTTRREQGGTGLGLGIVRALLAAHGGTIALSDTGGDGGASFEILLRA